MRPDRYADQPPLPYWPLFIEKLLLAIIDANPIEPEQWSVKSAEGMRQARLSEALHALFGTERRAGAVSHDDLPLLMNLVRRRFFDEGLRFMEQEIWKLDHLSELEDFTASISEIAGRSLPNADIARLRKKYKDPEFRAYASMVVEFSPLEEEREMNIDLKRLAEILCRWNVGMQIDPLRLGMASLANKSPYD